VAGRTIAVALVSVSMVLAAGCSSGSELGTVRGRFLTEGGFTDRVRPVPGVVTIERADGTKTEVRTGRDGRFRVVLPSGAVSLSGRTPTFNGGDRPCGWHRDVQVSRGSTTQADVVCFIR
jgi:hypothetical protein